MLAWHELETRISNAERVLITSHVRPDGDSLGSALAMADLLLQKGKEVEIFNPSPTPPRYWFMDPDHLRVRFLMPSMGKRPAEEGEHESPRLDPDLILILDTGTWSQLAGLADYVRRSKAAKIVIDHHVSQDDLGALRLVDVSAAACGMLVLAAFDHLKGEMTPQAATNLFVAIAMDTGWMRHSNTDPVVLSAMSRLVTAGANPSELYRQLFESNRIERLRLLGLMLERLKVVSDGKLAYSHLTWDDILSVEAHPMETEDFINQPMSIKGVEAALLFIGQREGGTKVSFRSHGGLDCSAMAARFGGGGHRAAAGATLDLPVEAARDEVVAATTAMLNGRGPKQ